MKKIALPIAAVVGLAATALAQPGYINYQGRLLDAAGQPLTNGTYTLQFNIFDTPNGTNLVWGPFVYDDRAGAGHAARAVIANGRFNVILGPHDIASRPLTNAFLGDERFVEITVNGGSPILPRQQILSAPYALRATAAVNADQLNHSPPTDYFLPPGMVVPFAGPTNNIPAGWLLCDGSQASRAERSRLFAAIGIAWGSGNGTTTFHLPDLRGMFLRGVNGSRADALGDPDSNARAASASGGLGGNNVGSVQDDALQNATGDIGRFNRFAAFHGEPNGPFYRHSAGGDTGVGSGSGDTWDTISFNLARQVRASSETRPNNAYVHYIIKY